MPKVCRREKTPHKRQIRDKITSLPNPGTKRGRHTKQRGSPKVARATLQYQQLDRNANTLQQSDDSDNALPIVEETKLLTESIAGGELVG